ncbi:MAG: AAA family ATPase [Planctomycetales bacterium]|nr:AAA family ATPase [Planctomycetales bacterium]
MSKSCWKNKLVTLRPWTPRSTPPQDLADLAIALLRRDPDQRPQYADIARVCGENKIDFSREPFSEVLLGRETQLAALESVLRKAQSDAEVAVAMVSGRSGEGKSALIDGFLEGLRGRDDLIVLRGRCYDQESVPYKALDSVVDALASHLRKIDSLRAAVLLPDDTGFLAALFPVLNRAEAVSLRRAPNLKMLDETQIRKRAYGALQGLLYRLSEHATIVLVIDDLHWGDAASAEAVHFVTRGVEQPRLLFIGGYRSDEADTSPFLNAWSALQKNDEHSPAKLVEVGPLTRSQCQRLIQDCFGEQHENLSALEDKLYEESSGNPFLLKELLDCVRACGVTLERIPMQEVISQKIDRLPEGAAAILHTVAIAGKQLSAALIERVAEIQRGLPTVLNHMRNERLVRFLDASDARLVDTYHDKVRETTLAMLSEDERRTMHRRFVDALKQTASLDVDAFVQGVLQGATSTESMLENVFELADHARSAGLGEEAAALTLLAAEQARARHAQDVASELFAIAYKRLESGQIKAAAYRIMEGYATCLTRTGEYERAESVLKQAREHGFDELQRLRILQLSADVAFRDSRMDESIQYNSEIMQACGVKVPRTTMGRALKSFIEAGRSFFWKPPGDHTDLRPARTQESFLLQASASLNMTSAFSTGDSFFWPIWAGLNRSHGVRPDSSMMHALAMSSCVWTLIGFTKRGERQRRLAAEYLSILDDHLAAAATLGLIAYGSMSIGQFELTRTYAAQADREAVAAGDRWYRNFAQLHAAMGMYFVGQLDECAMACQEILQRCASGKDMRSNCAFYVMQRLAGDHVNPQVDTSLITRQPNDILSTCNLHKGLALAALRDGKLDEAIAYLEEACQRPLKVRMPHVYVYAGFPLLAMVLRRKAIVVRKANPTEASRLLKRAAKLTGRGRWVARWMRSELPFTLREYGLTSALLGKRKKAIRLLQQSCHVAKELQAHYELILSKHALAKLQVEQGVADAERFLDEAEAELAKYREMIKRGFAAAGVTILPVPSTTSDGCSGSFAAYE